MCLSYGKTVADPHCGLKDGQLIKHWHAPVNQRFQLDLWYLPSARHFEALIVKLSLNPIMTQKMADLQNSDKRL